MSTPLTDDLEDEELPTNKDAEVLQRIKRNIHVLQREIDLGVRVDRTMLREMEAEYQRLLKTSNN